MATYYVDSSAAGGGNGSAGTPWNSFASITGTASGDRIGIKGTFTGPLSPTVAGVTYEGYSSTLGDGGLATISGGSSGVDYNVAGLYFKNIAFSGGTSSSIYSGSSGAGDATFVKCTFTRSGGSSTFDGSYGGKYFYGCTIDGYQLSSPRLRLLGCKILNSSGWGVYVAGYQSVDFVRSCVITGCSSGGICVSANAAMSAITGCTIYGNSGPGISIQDSGTATLVAENLIYSNTTANVQVTTSTSAGTLIHNATYNGSVDSSKFAYQVDNISLSGDPLTGGPSAYVANNTAGAGALVRGAAYSGHDIGYWQYVGSGGGSTYIFNVEA